MIFLTGYTEKDLIVKMYRLMVTRYTNVSQVMSRVMRDPRGTTPLHIDVLKTPRIQVFLIFPILL